MQVDELTSTLRQGIREGVLQPGQALLQEELAKRFNVSRIPVRDALLTLAAEGLVRNRPGGGLAVSQLEAHEVEELYDLRLMLEPALAEHVVHSASPRAIREWRALAQRLRGIDPAGPQWVEQNYRFHLAMYEAAGREHTLRLIRSLLDLTTPYSRLFISSLHQGDAVHDEHDAMVDAIEAGDVERLRTTIEAHLRATRESVAAFLRERETRSPIRML